MSSRPDRIAFVVMRTLPFPSGEAILSLKLMRTMSLPAPRPGVSHT